MASGGRQFAVTSAPPSAYGIVGGVNDPTLSPTYRTPFMMFGSIWRERKTILLEALDKPLLWKEFF